MSLKKIVLIGAGGFGRETAFLIELINSEKPTYELVGFLDDGSQYQEGMDINGYPWLGKSDWILSHKDEIFCNCTIGNPSVKGKLQQSLGSQGVRFESIISKRVNIHPTTTIGDGCVFFGGVTLSVNCKIGAGVFMNQWVTIGHDTVIGDYTTIMPSVGISGYCQVGREVMIGGHAFVAPKRKIGDGATVASGSVVFSNVKSGTTVLGNPAKRFKAIEN